MIKLAQLEAALSKIKGMMPGQKDQPNVPLRTGIGAGIGAGLGTTAVSLGNSINPEVMSLINHVHNHPTMKAIREAPKGVLQGQEAGIQAVKGLSRGVSTAKRILEAVLLAKRNPARTIGGLAAAGGAIGLGSGLMAKKSSSNAFYLCGFIQKCADAGMNEEQIKQAFLGRLGKSIGSLGRMFGQARSGLPTNVLQAQHPGLMHRAAKGVGSLFGKAERSSFGAGTKEIGKGVGENMSPLIQWIRQHPMYASGVGLGTAGAGAGLQSAIGDMSE